MRRHPLRRCAHSRRPKRLRIMLDSGIAIQYLREVEALGGDAPFAFRCLGRRIEELLPDGVGPTLVVIDGTQIGPDGIAGASTRAVTGGR